MKKLPLLVFLLVLFSIVVYPYPPQVKAAAGDKTVIWFCSDVHIGSGQLTYWQDAVNDANNTLHPNYAFCVGDMLDDFLSQPSRWTNFLDAWNGLTNVIYKNLTIGNHDGSWWIYTDTSENYTYIIGNLLICVIGDESVTASGAVAYNGVYGNQTAWLNSTIQSYQATGNYNVFLLCHHPLYDTTSNPVPYLMKEESANATIIAMMEWMNSTQDYKVDLFVHGHVHADPNDAVDFPIMTIEKYGSLHIDTSAISRSGKTSSDSVFCYLENGSTEVTLEMYSHLENTNYSGGANRYPRIFNLTYAFNPDYNSSSLTVGEEWVSINSLSNASYLRDGWRNYSGNATSAFKYYQVQVANTSVFTSPFIDIQANVTNYPGNFGDDGDVFWVNDTTTLIEHGGDYGRHYYRYRPYYRTVTG